MRSHLHPRACHLCRSPRGSRICNIPAGIPRSLRLDACVHPVVWYQLYRFLLEVYGSGEIRNQTTNRTVNVDGAVFTLLVKKTL